MPDLPKKLKQDAIVEALLEIRFEHDAIGEVVLGRLAAATPWTGYQTIRLPLAELPTSIREADPNLRYQPIIQLQRPTPGEIIKIGPRVASLHVLSPYPGWGVFYERLAALVTEIYNVVQIPHIVRLGLRYVNAVSPIHGISSLTDLDFRFEVGDAQPGVELMVSYRTNPHPTVRGQVTIASPSFAEGAVPLGAIVLVDVDMSTPSPLGPVSKEDLLSWLTDAHNEEKSSFFALWPEDKLNELREQ